MGNKLKIMETAIRDGQQSLIATRMPMSDMAPILKTMDSAGYDAIECWGGATFDTCIRYLDEDPWERLRFFREMMPNTRLQMLLRGQNLLGYRHYADDLVDEFVKKSIEKPPKSTELTFSSECHTRSANRTRSSTGRNSPMQWKRWVLTRSASRIWPG